MLQNKIFKIVLTGGPCSGKSSALNFLRAKLEDLDYLVITVNEAATHCISSGFHPALAHVSSKLLQQLIIGYGVYNEAIMQAGAEEIAKHMPVVILYDRGIADSSAYIDGRTYGEQLDRYHLKSEDVHNRYRAIIHMVTAAIGAEEHYTTANNDARTETAEQAAVLDGKIMRAWQGHPHHETIDNSTDFDTKLHRTLAAICRHIELPYEANCERKFLVNCTIDDLPDHPVALIKQRYLKQADGEIMRIRFRTLNGATVCTKAWKRRGFDDALVYTHDEITSSEYHSLSAFGTPAEIVKNRHLLLLEKSNLRFSLDKFADAQALPPMRKLLEVTTATPDTVIAFPECFEDVQEVTGDRHYSNQEIAKRVKHAA